MAIDAARNLEARRRLVAALRTQRTLGVTGAGVSAYAGYGTWWGVLHRLAEEVERHSRGAGPDADVVINANRGSWGMQSWTASILEVNMFRIKRPQLLAQIWELSKSGSVVLTGSPGVGKSWMIAQLIRECRAENRPYLPIAAEDFDIRSIDELGSALQFKTDILSFLKSLGTGPVLLIDGLDALRGELSQRVFRELIRRVSREVSNCSVIASIRTFDLQQSEQLQQLFFSSWPGRSAARTFTRVAVPPFSEEDLEAVIQQVPGLRPLVESSGAEIRDLLRIPFNLHIASSLIESGVTAEALAGFQSQVQLLDKYWSLRIEQPNDSSDRKQLLRSVVTGMVSNKSLSVAEAVVDSVPSDVIARLQSDEILRKGVTGRVSFSHNILFDYGSARLLLDEETVFSFVREDPSRTIFYRPTPKTKQLRPAWAWCARLVKATNCIQVVSEQCKAAIAQFGFRGPMVARKEIPLTAGRNYKRAERPSITRPRLVLPSEAYL